MVGNGREGVDVLVTPPTPFPTVSVAEPRVLPRFRQFKYKLVRGLEVQGAERRSIVARESGDDVNIELETRMGLTKATSSSAEEACIKSVASSIPKMLAIKSRSRWHLPFPCCWFWSDMLIYMNLEFEMAESLNMEVELYCGCDCCVKLGLRYLS